MPAISVHSIILKCQKQIFLFQTANIEIINSQDLLKRKKGIWYCRSMKNSFIEILCQKGYIQDLKDGGGGGSTPPPLNILRLNAW